MKTKCKVPSNVGDTRIKTWFAILPVHARIGEDGVCYQTRWMETVTVYQRLETAGLLEAPVWSSLWFVES